jgi:hypothetical protein
MAVAKHPLVEMESAVPPTLKHATAVHMIVRRALYAGMVSVQGPRTAPHAPMIVGCARKNPPVVMASAMAQKIVAHALGIVEDRVHCLRAPMDNIWMEMETVLWTYQIVLPFSLEVSGTVPIVSVPMEGYTMLVYVGRLSRGTV